LTYPVWGGHPFAMANSSYGQIGYEAYGEAAGWRTFDGRPMPTWSELAIHPAGLETQRRWEVASARVIEEARADDDRVTVPDVHMPNDPWASSGSPFGPTQGEERIMLGTSRDLRVTR
jgi:hypothetical protein